MRSPIAIAQMRFRHDWRPYQQRVLDAVHEHLGDSRLHVVAAPGAGKTSLGLEVFRLLGKPAMVLSPTRVIRDQWIDRLRDFLPGVEPAALEWVSTRICRPAWLTSVTYQALHFQMVDVGLTDPLDDEIDGGAEEGVDDEAVRLERDPGITDVQVNAFVALLREHGVGVLILDEAHHLRSQWWVALEKVHSGLPDLVLVSLTATPPYDVSEHEWRRYEQLCGPIDEEISVPELVKAGTLCPHQDYVWACNSSRPETELIRDHDERVFRTCSELFADKAFNAFVRKHPWLMASMVNPDEILGQPELAVAMLAFLKAQGDLLPPGLLSLIDYTAADVPALTRRAWQVLLESCVSGASTWQSVADKAYLDQLRARLRLAGLLVQRELSIERSRRIERSLALSARKIRACVLIHMAEYQTRRTALRQVILVDFIRDEAPQQGRGRAEDTLGGVPVFTALLSSTPIADQVALLTGRLSLVPTPLVDELMALGAGISIGRGDSRRFPGHTVVNGPLNALTTGITHLLLTGRIKTLVGTRALLGEGWDAPVVNSLVLASAVGSYMLTNQMRGRAIRIDRHCPNKVASIWHLVSICDQTEFGWADHVQLVRRFETFAGLSEKEPVIESGFARMNASALNPFVGQPAASRVAANNRVMLERYRTNGGLRRRWQAAIAHGDVGRVVPSVTALLDPKIRYFELLYTLRSLLIHLLIPLSGSVYGAMQLLLRDVQVGAMLIGLGLLGYLVYRAPTWVPLLRVLVRHLPIDGHVKQIGLALRVAMCNTGLIQTPLAQTTLRVWPNDDGGAMVALVGGTFYESSLFADALGELLGPIDNPRYLVERRGRVFGMSRHDYHAVPICLGVRKGFAEAFYDAWLQQLGSGELIYTRTENGRKVLLKAKVRAFSAVFAGKVRRLDRWR